MVRGTGDRQKLLSYATERDAPEYRAIMDFFLDAAAEYRSRVTVDDVVVALRSRPPSRDLDRVVVERRLDSLYEWGNLYRDRDESRAIDLVTYERRSFVYSLSPGGEAAHEALIGLEDRIQRAVGLQSAALRQVLSTLTELVEQVGSDPPDGELVFHRVEELHRNFKALTADAAIFVQKVTRFLESPSLERGEFENFKADTIGYLTGFMDDLKSLAGDIRGRLRRLVELGPDRLSVALAAGAPASGEHSLSSADSTTWDQVASRHVAGVMNWFSLNESGADSGADRLHAVVRRAVVNIGDTVTRFRQAALAPSSLAVDMLTLARWFQHAPDDRAAHEIWHKAFGLGSARHFVRESPSHAKASESWWTAPTERYEVRLRAISAGDRPRRASHVPDHRPSRQLLAIRAQREQAEQRDAATWLVELGGIRLSELASRLDRTTLALLATLLSRAHRVSSGDDGVRSALSVDGRLRIRLREPRRQAAARIESEIGFLTVPDYEVEITWAHHGHGPAKTILAGTDLASPGAT